MTHPPGPTGPDDGDRDTGPGPSPSDPWATPSSTPPSAASSYPSAPYPTAQPGQPDGPYAQPGYPPYPQPGYGYPGYSPYPYPAKTNGKAVAALWTGVGSLLLNFCCGAGVIGLVAIVLGAKARSEIRTSGGRETGEGLALAGIITGAIAVLLGIVAIVVVVIALANYGSNFDEFDQTRV